MESHELWEAFIGGAHLEISRDQFNQLVAAKAFIRTMWDVEESFDLFARAFCELEEYLLITAFRSAANLQTLTSFADSAGATKNNINLRLLTLLSSFRGYDDISCKRLSALKKIGGHDFLGQFKGLLRDAYDRDICYRLFCGLRNHGQHHQLPLTGFSTGTKSFWEDRGDKQKSPMRIRQTIDPYISVNDILEGEAIKSDVKEEIRKLAVEKIDLKFFCRSVTNSLFQAHSEFRRISEDGLKGAFDELARAKETLSVEKGGDAQHVSVIHRKDGDISAEHHIDPVDYSVLHDVRTRWSGLNRIEVVFVSSEINRKSGRYPGANPAVWISE